VKKSIDNIKSIPLRDVQKEILSQIKPNKINLIVAATGCGKSLLAANFARNHNGVQIITPNRALQSQYFEQIELANLWGQSHYHCDQYNVSCDKCDEHLSDDIESLNEDNPEYDDKKVSIISTHKDNCEYLIERDFFKSSKYGVTGVELCYFGIRNRSECLVIDEAHNLIDKLTNLSGSKISSNSQLFGDIFQNLNELMFDRKIPFDQFIAECISRAKTKANDENEVKRAKKANWIKKLESIAEDLEYFSYEVSKNSKGIPSTEIKKLNLHYEFRTLIKDFESVYMMTATLPDISIFCKILGIKKDEINVIHADSPFSPDNVKVICYTDAVLTSKEYDNNIDRAVEIVDEILTSEPNRGIIHCTSFKQIKDIRERLNPKYFYRLIYDDQEMTKEELLQELTDNPRGVIVSASAYEGIDLYGDLGTFSITFKAPFPIFTPWIQAMNNRYYDFYNVQALSRFIQGLGRCLRNFNDKANIYLVDRCCGRYIKDRRIPANIRKARRIIVDAQKRIAG